jgi:hypothetical protein
METVSGRIRGFVYAFLLLVAVCTIGAFEYMPLTGFRLYHELRKPTHPSWQLVTVDAAGAERPASLHTLPVAYHDTERQLGRSADDLDHARAVEICRAWADAFDDPLRVYRARIDARTGHTLTRRLMVECAP